MCELVLGQRRGRCGWEEDDAPATVTADDDARDGRQGDGLHAARRGVDSLDDLGGGAGTGRRMVAGGGRGRCSERFVTDRVEI